MSYYEIILLKLSDDLQYNVFSSFPLIANFGQRFLYQQKSRDESRLANTRKFLKIQSSKRLK